MPKEPRHELSAMLEAHVQFELQQWSETELATTIRAEVDALFVWLEAVRLENLVPLSEALVWARRLVSETILSDELTQTIEAAIQAAWRSLLEEQTRLGELLPRAQYDQFVETLIGMKRLRHEVTQQITTSSVYSMLVAHVLYQGIKSFMLTENVLAKKIPGASSLLRFGQNALNSAAPNLEKGIDKQLIAFINANIQETINESTRYLNSVVDDATLWSMAEDLWKSNSGRTLAVAAGFVESASLDDLVDSGRNAWLALRQSPPVLRLVEGIVREIYRRHGSRPLRTVCAELGITPEAAAQEFAALAAPSVRAARRSGYLEARIRGRLAPFYAAYGASQG